jgi:hypothetical protein
LRSDGGEIGDDDVLQVAINDFLALGGDDILTPIIPEQGFEVPDDAPLVRDALVDWFRARGGTISEDDFLENGALRWNVPEPLPAGCN